jgi:hypothetical protein
MNGDYSDEEKKKAVFNSMSPRRQKHILKKVGYNNWDPFEKPKDPIDIRKDKTKRTSQMLVREFLQACPMERYSNSYGRGALEMAMGIVNNEDRFIAMYEFALWYRELLEKEGHAPSS